MKRLLLAAAFLLSPLAVPSPAAAAQTTVDTMVSGAGGVVWSVAFAPDGRFFYSVRGTGEVFQARPGEVPRLLIDLPSCGDCGEGGLMGLATSPGFADDGALYAMYTYRSGGAITNRVVRLAVGAQSATVAGVVLDGIPGGTTHDGGRLRFGPDGMLYATTGDGRISPNPARDTASLAGKVLRLDPRGGPAAGNPFGNAVWSYGHRNPQGLDFRDDGQLFALEHGPGCRDELNRITRGGDYGWTGDERCPPPAPAGSIAPVAVYTETSTIAPSGASFYRSTAIPEWTGSLFFSTLKDQTLHRVTLTGDGTAVSAREELYRGSYGRLRDVQAAPDGSLWLTTDDGRILRVRAVSGASASPSAAPACQAARAEPAADTLTATGEVEVTLTGAPGSRVDLFAYTRPASTFALVRSVTQPTSAGPAPVVRLRPPANTRMYAQQAGCAPGPQVVLNVRTALTLTAARNGPRDYVFAGDSLPARPGGLVVSLYRVEADGRQVLTAQTRADASTGQWRIERRFGGSGRFGFVVRTGQDLQNAPGSSNVRSTLVY